MKGTRIILILTALLNSLQGFGTAQIPDFLITENDTVALFSNPLELFYNEENKRPESFFGEDHCYSTACWRGYIAYWKLENNKLFLVEIASCCGDSLVADLSEFFGDKYVDNKVFTDWVSGDILSPQGVLLNYVHMGYGSIYQKEIVYSFEKGLLTDTVEYSNFFKKSLYTENLDTLKHFIYSNIQWDLFPEFKNDTVQYKVFLQIIPTIEGKIDSVVVRRGDIEQYNKEAIRVVGLIPEWEVLIQRGKLSKLYWTIPVIFNNEMKRKYYQQ